MKEINVVCFGGIDWWYHNRGHMDTQMMRRFAKKGRLLFINSIVMTKPNLKESRKLLTKITRKIKSFFAGMKRVEEGFWVWSPFVLPVQHLNWLRSLNEKMAVYQIRRNCRKLEITDPLIWVATPVVCNMALRLGGKKLVYQRTDRFEDFPGVDRNLIQQFDRTLKAHADLTIFVNSSLFEEERHQCKHAFYLDHGVDYERFACDRSGEAMPDDLAGIPGPRIGFFGSIDDCNPDLVFLEKVINLLPEMSFVFVGQALCDCTALTSHKNVWMLGKKSYEEVPSYGKCFDVLMLPLKQDNWSKAVNPAKLKEYLALGKPVVATPFPELNKYLDVVYQAKDPESYARIIQQAIAENSEQKAAQRKKRVEGCSWNSKAETVIKELFETG